MGQLPSQVSILQGATGNPLDGAIARSVLDDALGAMSSKLLILLRAVKISPAAAAIVDSLGNKVAAKTGATKNPADPLFNNHESITLNNQNNIYTMTAGGIGIGVGPQPMTNSFTVLAGVNETVAETSSLYGDTAGTTGSAMTGAYIDNVGEFHCIVGGTVDINGGPVILAPGATGVIWWSYDAATRTHRLGCTTPAVAQTAVGTQTRNGAGTGTVCYPFGYQTSGTCGAWSFHRWALFNKAFMNGAVPADDQQFAALLATYKSYLNI